MKRAIKIDATKFLSSCTISEKIEDAKTMDIYCFISILIGMWSLAMIMVGMMLPDGKQRNKRNQEKVSQRSNSEVTGTSLSSQRLVQKALTNSSTLTRNEARKPPQSSWLKPKHKISNVSISPSQLQMESVKRLLECPVCLEVSRKPMFLCENGHSICISCRVNLKKCFLCKGKITPTRSLLHEQITQTSIVQVKCKYASEGCPEVMPWFEMDKKHAGVCHFRPLKCLFNCENYANDDKMSPENVHGSLFKYNEYMMHLLHVHEKINVKTSTVFVSMACSGDDTRGKSMRNTWHDYGVAILECYGETFIAGTFVLEGTLCWWVYVFGDKKTADEYTSSIFLRNQETGLKISWAGQVYDIRSEPAEIAKSGLCLTLPEEKLELFMYCKNRIASQEDNNLVKIRECDVKFIVRKKTKKTAMGHRHALLSNSLC